MPENYEKPTVLVNPNGSRVNIYSSGETYYKDKQGITTGLWNYGSKGAAIGICKENGYQDPIDYSQL